VPPNKFGLIILVWPQDPDVNEALSPTMSAIPSRGQYVTLTCFIGERE
jgi:hypothetical protein